MLHNKAEIQIKVMKTKTFLFFHVNTFKKKKIAGQVVSTVQRLVSSSPAVWDIDVTIKRIHSSTGNYGGVWVI